MNQARVFKSMAKCKASFQIYLSFSIWFASLDKEMT